VSLEQKEHARAAAARLGGLVDDKYHLSSVLGVGGMGAVFAAQHRFTDRKVAVKLLHPKYAKGKNLQRFLQEAKAAAHIDHARIAQVLDAGQTSSGELYLVMELLEGEDLGGAIREGRAGPDRLVQVGLQTLEALDKAHTAGFVHRDIKPGNIFLCGEPGGPVDARLLDFGVARRLDSGAQRLTQAGAVVGTPYFMSPEQMCGEAVDGRADLWALGVVLFYGLTGSLPFRAETYVALLRDMLDTGPPSPRVLKPELDPTLAEVVTRCLSPHIEDRYPDAAQMRAALAGVASGARRSPTPPLESVRVAPAPEPPPATRAPAQERPPAWASALEAIESEISALEAPPAPPAKKAGWLSRLRKK